MRRYFIGITLAAALAVLLVAPLSPAHAQEGTPTPATTDLGLFTDYPSRVVGIGDTVTWTLSLITDTRDQVVQLEMDGLPEGWTATFRGGGQVIQSVSVRPGTDASADLRVTPPADVEPGRYSFTVGASSDVANAELPLVVIIQERVPPSLSFEVELPTLRAEPTGTFRYNVTLENSGDEDVIVDLLAEAPSGFNVTFTSAGQEVTSLPLQAGGSERLIAEVQPLRDVQAGEYSITIRAQGGEAQASAELTAVVVGQSALALTTPSGRLSGEAHAGEQTTYSLLLQNTGTAPAQDIELSATQPNGWTVEFEPQTVAEVPPGQQIEVTARVTPDEQTIAGDYVVTFRARPEEVSAESAEFRVTVRTSTLWGIGGVALIAIAVVVVGFAVTRFGRR